MAEGPRKKRGELSLDLTSSDPRPSADAVTFMNRLAALVSGETVTDVDVTTTYTDVVGSRTQQTRPLSELAADLLGVEIRPVPPFEPYEASVQHRDCPFLEGVANPDGAQHYILGRMGFISCDNLNQLACPVTFLKDGQNGALQSGVCSLPNGQVSPDSV
jgi:hypothetical protein